ncbi:reverse transcriptase [Trichostrongylus colubriformis]|uniref:Reverse transcriptase n=1 Tax=Trichostrongylus colubriformis TaxID=6319 RepID=A0AAN8FTY5_TRICO
MWMALEPSILVLDTMINGYTIPFDEAPEPPHRDGNRKSALRHAVFVDITITDLISNGAIKEVANPQVANLFVHPLSVAEGRKLRLVLDLSSLNKYVTKEYVKFDDMAKIQHLLPWNGFMTTFDLKSGYHHVRIAEQSQNFLGFSWNSKFFKFTVLPFGLSSAPHIFTKILRPLIKKWRGEGKGVAIYLDDGLIWANSRSGCKATSEGIRKELKEFGWFEAEQKSVWSPSSKATWLGFDIDLNSFEISISKDRIEGASSTLQRMLQDRAPSLHARMRWEGSLASMSLVISDNDKRRTRAITTAIAEAQSSECALSYRWSLSTKEKRDIYFWSERLTKGMLTSLSPPDCPPAPQFIIEVDASAHSVGAVLRGSSNRKAHSVLPESLKLASSTSRELWAIHFGLLTFGPVLAGNILLRTDNQAACRIYRVGSNLEYLQQQAEDIWELQESLKLNRVTVEWIPREQNVLADLESRELDYDSWGINSRTAQAVQNNLLLRVRHVCR